MYRSLFGLAALAAALVLPLSASADTIDDFVLTGGGHTITYSLPATTVFPYYCFSCDFFYVNMTGAVDGVPGYQLTAGYGYGSFIGDLHLLPDPIFGYGAILFQGPQLITLTLVPSSDPIDPYDMYNDAITFIPGTYSLIGAGVPSSPFGGPQGPDIPFTLTITPQTETAATPEPPTLALLTTGLFALLGFAAIRLGHIKLTP